jgi:hypothetical protein
MMHPLGISPSNNVVAESDSMEVIQACTGEEAWWGDSSAIYANCTKLATTIGNVEFRYCPREAKDVSHDLARNSFCDKNSCNWVDEPPNLSLENS